MVIVAAPMEPCSPAVGTCKSLRQGHQRHIERGLVTRTRARPFKYSGSRPSSSRRRRRRAGSPGRGRRMSRTAARCSSKRSSSIPPGSTIWIEVGECHRGRRGGMREESGNNRRFPLFRSQRGNGPPVDFYCRPVGANHANARSMRMGARRRSTASRRRRRRGAHARSSSGT